MNTGTKLVEYGATIDAEVMVSHQDLDELELEPGNPPSPATRFRSCAT